MAVLFQNAILLQLDPPSVTPGDLRVQDGKIVAIGAGLTVAADDETIGCDGAVLMPGLVNGHTHLYSALAAGMPAPPERPANFHDILRYVWWRLDRAHTLESVRMSGTIGALAAVRCGTTTLIDHHSSPDAIAGSLVALEEGIATVGCRAVLCYETTCRNHSDEAREGLRENEEYIRLCQSRLNGQFAAMVGGHASFTLDERALKGCVDLARRLGVGVHLHAAEDRVDERLTRERTGDSLLARFQRHGLLELPGTILAHGTHFSDMAVARINASPRHVAIAHNPTSNMNNGVGYARPVRFAAPVMLGTDGIGADLLREARTALVKSCDADAALPLTGPLEMIGASARQASRALGVALGLLEAGAAADLVRTDYRPATPLSAENLAAHVLFALGAEHVRDVMIAGRWVLRRGQVVSCAERQFQSESVPVARALHQRMAALPCA
jgi:putative selenium metabolism protein SsnA